MTSASEHFDLIVIGSGAAGSSCWFAARAAGKSVAVFEEDALGGECANFACVPTKALLHAAEVLDTINDAARFGIEVGPVSFDYKRVNAWKTAVLSETGAALGEGPYEEAGVALFRDRARFVSSGEIEAGGKRFTAEKFLIATGAGPSVPPIPGLAEAGYLDFHGAIEIESLPGSVFILGGGAVGCEFSQLFSSFAAEVDLADLVDRLLPREDAEAGTLIAETFEQRGVKVMLSAAVTSLGLEDGKRRVTLSVDGREHSLLVDQVLVASGKRPNMDIGLDAAAVNHDALGIGVDEGMRTSNPNIFAAGDVVGPYRLTHAASYQGQVAFSNMFGGGNRSVDYRAMPRCVFTTPEVAAVGLTQEEARDQLGGVRVGMANIFDNDRGLTSGQRSGFVKVLTDDDGRLVGGVAVAPRAGDFMHELALAVALGASSRDVASAIHAFPTFSEALAAACAAVATD